MTELPANYEDAIEAFLNMDVAVFIQIGRILDEIINAYDEAAAIRNGEHEGGN